jgi:purine-binding chemotaxis protein CheW
MSVEREDMWQALLRSGETLATDEDYEHGYKRDVPQDLQQYVSLPRQRRDLRPADPRDRGDQQGLRTTHVPRTADFLVGIGNVRGRIIPVLDLGRRLGLAEQAYGRAARVLIVSFQGEPYGLLVHQVLEVVRIPPESMEERPGGISGRRAEYIRGLARHRGALIIILNLPEVLDPRDFLRLGADEERR